MLETCGTWHEMGGQIAEAFKPWFDPVLGRFAPWLSREPDKFRPAIARLRRLVLEYVPYVEEETQGMAAAFPPRKAFPPRFSIPCWKPNSPASAS